eukprot:gene4882-6839_t
MIFTKLLFSSIIALFLCCCLSTNHLLRLKGTQSDKSLLVLLLVESDYTQMDAIVYSINEYVNLCESGWNLTIHLFSMYGVNGTEPHWSNVIRRYFRQKLFCYFIRRSIPITYHIYQNVTNHELAVEPRIFLSSITSQNEYKLILFHESSVIITHSLVQAYYQEIITLRDLVGTEGLNEYHIGFLRYHRILRGGSIRIEIGGTHHFTEEEMFNQEHMEETPHLNPICIHNESYIHLVGNLQQSAWILTNEQLSILNKKCSFANNPHLKPGSSDSKSLFEYNNANILYDSNFCGMKKIIPAKRMMTFSISHYFPSPSLSSYSSYHVEEKLVTGYLPYMKTFTKSKFIESIESTCWLPFVSHEYNMLYANQTPPQITYQPPVIHAKVLSPFKDGMLIRFVADRQIYLIENNKKRPIPSLAIFIKHGYDTDQVVIVHKKDHMDALPDGEPLQ